MATSSQKFIARNRAPRVQIEYDVELYGAEKKVQLPFVMGVMADLAGKPVEPLPPVSDRKFLEIDVDNFDDRMRAMAPRVAFSVPNTLSGEGQLSVDITFAGMDDFSPAAIARQVEPLRKLLDARTELSNLLTYMDGKTGAEALIERFLQDPSLISALATDRPAAPRDTAETLAALRAAQPAAEAAPDEAAAVLAALRAAQPVAASAPDASASALAALRAAAPADAAPPDEAAAALAALRAAAPTGEAVPDEAASALAALRAAAPAAEVAPDEAAAAFAALRTAAPSAEAAPDASAAALAALRAAQPAAAEAAPDESVSALAALRAAQPAAEAAPDESAAALAALRAAAPSAESTPDEAADALATLRTAAPSAEAAPDGSASALAALRAAQPAAAEAAPDESVSALAALRAAAPASEAAPDASAAALAALRAAQPATAAAPDGSGAALAALRAAQPAAEAAPDESAATLAALRASQPDAEVPPDESAAALAALRSSRPAEESAPDDSASALAALRAAQPAAEPVQDASADALAALRAAQPTAAEAAPDAAASALAALRAARPGSEPTTDDSASALAALRGSARSQDPLEGLLDDEGASATPDLLDDLLGDAPSAPDPLDDLLADAPAAADALDDLLGDVPAAPDPLDDLLAEPPTAATPDPLDDLLGDMPSAAPDPLDDLLGDGSGAADPLGDLLGDAPAAPDPLDDLLAEPPAAATSDPLDDLLSDASAAPDPLDDLLGDAPTAPDPLDDLLGDGSGTADPLDDLLAEPNAATAPDPLDGLLADPPVEDDPLAGLDDLLSDTPPSGSVAAPEADPLGDLEALLAAPLELPADDPLAGLDDLLAGVAAPEEDDPLAGLDALLANPPPPADDPLAGLEELLAMPAASAATDPLAELDALLAAPLSSDPAGTDAVTSQPPPPPVYGTISTPAPAPERLQRKVFRIAVFGDFTGRAASGRIETGAALASRRAIPFDVDTVEEVIESFATTLVLPIGPEGRGIAVELAGLDSLHPDELVDSVDVFSELKGLRQRLSSSSMAARAVEEMKRWGTDFATPLAPTSGRSGASSVPADRRLSDFQRLIGDREGKLTQASPAADFIGQIVGPHVVPGPNPEAAALRAGVDDAMASAMRLILHHPEFQAIEAQWRSLDLLARRIETDVKLRVDLFDISAEELAADLATHDDLSQSGFFKLVNAPLTEDGGVGFSSLFGLYTFEETPPHADLLGRIATVAAHVQAPFFTAMSPAFLDVALKDRHPLIEEAWGTLRADPVAKWLGVASPRFLLRRPYGAKSEPIDAFDFEEFTMSEGLSGMLWGNPVVLVAILVAESWKQGGAKMELGKIMSVDDMPFHYATDRHGDQVALPCTERNVTTEKIDRATGRGFMPMVAPKARNEVRLASFRSVAGEPILGPWSGVQPALVRQARAPQLQVSIPATAAAAPAAGGDDLDSLLAGFGDSAAPADPNAIDADLASLLEGL